MAEIATVIEQNASAASQAGQNVVALTAETEPVLEGARVQVSRARRAAGDARQLLTDIGQITSHTAVMRGEFEQLEAALSAFRIESRTRDEVTFDRDDQMAVYVFQPPAVIDAIAGRFGTRQLA